VVVELEGVSGTVLVVELPELLELLVVLVEVLLEPPPQATNANVVVTNRVVRIQGAIASIPHQHCSWVSWRKRCLKVPMCAFGKHWEALRLLKPSIEAF